MSRIYDLDLIAGRAITDADMNSEAPVAIIGHDILDNLMPDTDPVGKEIRVDGRIYSVIGVGKKEGKTLGQSRDNWVIMPITTFFKGYGSHNSLRIWGKGYDVGLPLEKAIDDARVIMRSRRHDAPGQPDSFSMETNENFLAIWASQWNVLRRDDRNHVYRPRCRWHCDHEHHARFGHRANSRDWNSESHGR